MAQHGVALYGMAHRVLQVGVDHEAVLAEAQRVLVRLPLQG